LERFGRLLVAGRDEQIMIAGITAKNRRGEHFSS
jgi:hypothetical protein